MWGGLWRTGSERRATSSAPPLFILRIFRERLAWGVFAEGLLARSLAERFLLRILREGFLFGRAAVGGFILRVLGTLAERLVLRATAEGDAGDGGFFGDGVRGVRSWRLLLRLDALSRGGLLRRGAARWRGGGRLRRNLRTVAGCDCGLGVGGEIS